MSSISSKDRRSETDFFLIKPTATVEESTSKPYTALFLHQLWKYRAKKHFQQCTMDTFSDPTYHIIKLVSNPVYKFPLKGGKSKTRDERNWTKTTTKTSCSIRESISFFRPSAVKVCNSDSPKCLLYSARVACKAALWWTPGSISLLKKIEDTKGKISSCKKEITDGHTLPYNIFLILLPEHF